MIELRRVGPLDESVVAGLSGLLIDAVQGGASVGFLASLSLEEAEAYWRSVLASTARGTRLWVAEGPEGVVGTVQLALCEKPNGLHRAELQKLLVLRSHRGQRIASRLMSAAEDGGRAEGRTLLVLDTEAGSSAESIYLRLGWQRVGAIPDYAGRPDGTLIPTVVFYKKLSPPAG